MQRSILVLVLALSVVVLLTAVIFENPPVADQAASPELPRQVSQLEAQRNFDRYYMLAEAYWKRGQLVKAETMVRAALMQQRHNVNAIRLYGAVMYARGHYADAETAFSQLPRLAPTDFASYTNLAIVQLCQDKLPEAELTLQQADSVLAKPLPAPLALVRACVLAKKQDVTGAEAALTIARKALGSGVIRATTTEWAKALTSLPNYESILGSGEEPQTTDALSGTLLPATGP